MRLVLGDCTLRSVVPSDAEALARHANDLDVWRNLRDAFPHPYTLQDAERFISTVTAAEVETVFAIELAQQALGCVGFTPGTDVERGSAEVGYWLGKAFWGRGIMSQVVTAFSAWLFTHQDLDRLFATPFAWNLASARVLEKAGYVLEGRLRASARKDGVLVDKLMYARLALAEDGR